MAYELTFNITEDRRPLVAPSELHEVEGTSPDDKIIFGGKENNVLNDDNWVQARYGEDDSRQVFVNVTQGKNNEPVDLTGINPWFCGRLPGSKKYIIVDNWHGTVVDPHNGRFRFDFPKQAFAVAGSYKRAYFRLVKAGTGYNVATLEFDLEVLADFVFDSIVPQTYITPFFDVLNQLKSAFANYKAQNDKDAKEFKAQLQADSDSFKKQYDDAVKAKQDELQNTVNNYTDKIDTMLKDLNQQGIDTSTMLTDLRSQMAALQDKINSEHLFTEDEAKKFEDSINDRMDHFEAVVDGFKAKWHDVEVIDFNPTRDGKAHTLSESYASVDEAQKDYPAATSLADTKDWCAITEAIQKGQQEGQNVYVAPGHYVVNKTITLPTDVKFYGAYQNSRIFASQQMCEDSKKNPIAILEYDDEGQPPLYIENIHVLGNSDTSNQIVGLHVGGNRASRIVNLIVSNAYGHGTWIHATNEKSADVENMTFEHYWQVQSGSFRIESNANIDRGNITDFAVNDSQITSLDIHDDKQTNQSMPAVEIINDDSSSVVKTIYGISFARCFLHAQANNLVRIVGNHAPRATHSINFDFIKGELHDEHGGFSSLCDKYFLFHLESCWHVMIDHSTQLLYSGASYIEMKNAAFCDIKTAGILYLSWLHSDSKIFTMDELCYENHINLVGEDLFLSPGGTAFEKNPNLGYDYGNAVDAMDLFDKMVDKGADNHISGYQIAQTLTLNNEPHRLKDIDKSGKITGLMEAWQKGVTSSVEDNTVYSKHVFAKGVVNEMLMLPLLYKRTSGFLVSIRAIGNETDLKKMKVLVGSNFYNMPTDQEFHRWTGICPTSSLNAIGIQVFGENVTLDNDVTVEIEYLDAFMENKIPYYPDFVALPMPKVDESNFEEGTILHVGSKAEEAK